MGIYEGFGKGIREMNKKVGRIVVIGLALSYVLLALLLGFGPGFLALFIGIIMVIGAVCIGAVLVIFGLYLMYLFTDNNAEDFDNYMDKL
jgi:hypothetical protein